MEDTLLLVHVIFRHGDRTPDKESLYPTDPHKDIDYYPIGHGQLTNKGKQRAYKLGQILRKSYDKLLGEVYAPEHVSPFSSDFDRTKATLQLVLASLFTPKKEQVWEEKLAWQPIPYTCYPMREDKLFLHFLRPEADEIYNDFMKGPGKVGLDNNSNALQYIEEHSGLTINNGRQLLRMACTLKAEADLDLPLPEWTNKVWPHPLEELATCEYNALAAHPKLKWYTSGKLLEKILGDSQRKIEGDSPQKICLYSGHEITVAVLLRCLGFYYKHVPPYCSNFRLELHKIDGAFGFKVFYQSDLDEEARLLTPAKCADAFLPIERFEEIVADVLRAN